MKTTEKASHTPKTVTAKCGHKVQADVSDQGEYLYVADCCAACEATNCGLTPGAFRAAAAIFREWENIDGHECEASHAAQNPQAGAEVAMSMLAELIDRETAAPEMLEALEQAATAYELLIVSSLDFTAEERAAMEKDLVLFKAAIRKAKGE